MEGTIMSSSTLPLFRLKEKYYEDSSNTEYLEFLADMGKVKVPWRLLRNDYRKAIIEEAERGIDEDIEATLGKERAEEFREWIDGLGKKYSYLLPQILGEDFSYNLITLLFVTFLRYLYNRYLEEKKKRTSFVKEMEDLKLIQDILREGLWYKKSPTFFARPLSFYSHPSDGRKKGPKIAITFVKALLDTDFMCGREENIAMFREYPRNWLELALDEADKEHYENVEKFFKEILSGDFKKWFEKHFNIELVQGSCLWFKGSRHQTILNARCTTALWITKRIANHLKIKMNEDELFPRISKEEKERIKEWVEEFNKRKKKKSKKR